MVAADSPERRERDVMKKKLNLKSQDSHSEMVKISDFEGQKLQQQKINK